MTFLKVQKWVLCIVKKAILILIKCMTQEKPSNTSLATKNTIEAVLCEWGRCNCFSFGINIFMLFLSFKFHITSSPVGWKLSRITWPLVFDFATQFSTWVNAFRGQFWSGKSCNNSFWTFASQEKRSRPSRFDWSLNSFSYKSRALLLAWHFS